MRLKDAMPRIEEAYLRSKWENLYCNTYLNEVEKVCKDYSNGKIQNMSQEQKAMVLRENNTALNLLDEQLKNLISILKNNLYAMTETEILKIIEGDANLKLSRIQFQNEILKTVGICTQSQLERINNLQTTMTEENDFHHQLYNLITTMENNFNKKILNRM
eukprot:UN22810